MTTNDEVHAASDRFYSALSHMCNGDAKPMADVWSHGDGVSTMHPIGGCEVGWEQVSPPWKAVAEMSKGGEVRIDQQHIETIGDAAYEIGVEVGHIVIGGEDVKIGQRVTNVYRREGGAWKVVHHHADPSPAMLAALERIESKR